MTLGGTYLVLRDIFGQRLTTFLSEHLSGILGVVALLVALSCAYLLRQQRTPISKNNESTALDSQILSRFRDADIELKWLREAVDFYAFFTKQNAFLYWLFKVPTLVSAALIPICALLLKETPGIAAALGALIAICEGILHIGQFHGNWLRSVATREQLEHELYLFAASASVYSAPDAPKKASAILTERVIAIMQNEQAQWLEGHRSHAPQEQANRLPEGIAAAAPAAQGQAAPAAKGSSGNQD